MYTMSTSSERTTRDHTHAQHTREYRHNKWSPGDRKAFTCSFFSCSPAGLTLNLLTPIWPSLLRARTHHAAASIYIGRRTGFRSR